MLGYPPDAIATNLYRARCGCRRYQLQRRPGPGVAIDRRRPQTCTRYPHLGGPECRVAGADSGGRVMYPRRPIILGIMREPMSAPESI